jgi:proteasome accessory factor B
MLQIHEHLKRGEPVNCTTLAETLEFSSKTIARDLRFMRDRLKMPLEYDEHAKVWAYTKPDVTFPTIQATEGELFALMIARKALEQYRGTSFHPQLAGSFEKIAAALSDKVAFDATDELQTISFKSTGVGKADAGVFKALSRAVMRERELEFDYRKPGDSVIEWRRIRPYACVHHDGLWYVIGFDLERKALRTFAVPRMGAARATAKKFKRPADFSPDKYLAGAFGIFGGDGDHQVVIHFSATVADRIRERVWHATQQLRDLPAGGLEFEVRLGALPEIERWVLSWGAHARVIGPIELRDRVAKVVRELAREYSDPKPR